MIKFKLECFADYGIKISECLLGKIDGTKSFNEGSWNVLTLLVVLIGKCFQNLQFGICNVYLSYMFTKNALHTKMRHVQRNSSIEIFVERKCCVFFKKLQAYPWEKHFTKPFSCHLQIQAIDKNMFKVVKKFS